mgnify:FL=1|jgi:hypothetical protein|nr:MAG TPA: endonuclease-like protein [Bacteriophage sp.]
MKFKPKACKECGKMFTPRCGTQVYCSGPHITYCETCGRAIEYTCSPKEKPRYCCKTCRTEGVKKHNIEKYGVENVSQLDSVKHKISEANSSDEVVAKRQATCLSKYGVDNVSKSPEIRKKLSDIMKTDDYLDNRKQTCLDRYGFESPSQNPDIKAKKHATLVERYGQGGRKWSAEQYAKMSNLSDASMYLEFKEDPKTFIQQHFDREPTVYELQSLLGVTDTPIYDVLIAHNASDCISAHSSGMENEVISFIQSFYSGEILHNCRSVISPYELDIYLPELKIAIECNPAFTHNSSIQDPWGRPPKHYKYHMLKSDMCSERGIFLFHLFGYEWVNKKNILKSMIRNLLKSSTISIGARTTYVCEVDGSECKEFLDSNHRQGNTFASVRLGLRRKDTNELVSVMTFNHMRPTIGSTSSLAGTCYELSRFCNKLNTNVAGGASKLFKYFIQHYEFDSIVSFSDVSHTSGNLYKILGFQYCHKTDPNYIWSSIDDKIWYNRVSCQKRNLPKLFNDFTLDITHKTERQIMEEHGFVQVFDSGVIKWIYSL